MEYFTEEHGPLPASCRRVLETAEWQPLSREWVAELCREPLGRVAGCNYAWSPDHVVMVLDQNQDSPDLRVHELLHTALRCAGIQDDGTGDPKHTDAVWAHVPVEW